MKFVLLFALVGVTWRGAQAANTSHAAMQRQVQQAIDVPITIQEGVGASSFASSGYPVAVVVPFAKGAVFNESTLSILEGNPCQVVVLERWLSDGSIRHAQVHFQAAMTANSSKTLRLINTAPFPKPRPSQPVSVINDAAYVQVDTGRVRFRISKTSFNLIDQLWFDQNGNSTYDSNELMISSNSTNGGRFEPRSGAGGTQRDSARSDISVEVEESGPLRAVIKVSAATIFRSTTDHVHGFAVRFYAYAGQPHIKVDYQLQNSALNAVRSWPLYFEEMTVDLSVQLPNTSSPDNYLGTTTREFYNCSSASCRIKQYYHDLYVVEEFFDTSFRESSISYSRQRKNAAFVHLQSSTTGVTVAVRNFWQASPNGLGLTDDSKVSIELFPSFNSQFTTSGSSSTGLYWLNDMQQVYKEFLISFHSSSPSVNRLFDLASTFQFPPVASVSPSWYRSTRASLDLSGYLPDAITAPPAPDTFSPDAYWDSLSFNESSAFYKGNWINFGEVEGPIRATPCTSSGYPYEAEFYAASQYAAHYYVVETWGLGEVNVRPQSLPSYSYVGDYDRLKLTEAGNCSGSWRIFEGNGVSKFAAPFLNGTENVQPFYGARDDQFGWFYHVAQSYFYTGSYWVKDWYEFISQFRREFLLLKQPLQDSSSEAIAHALGHSLQAIRVTGESALIRDFADYFRGFLRRRQDLRFGSEFNRSVDIQPGYQTGYLMRTIINYMDLVRDVDVQLYAELFNYLSGLMERNLNVGNFAKLHDQYTVPGKGRSDSKSLTMIAPQAWYFWNTGKIQFWNQVQDYMNGNLGDRPLGAPWTGYPDANLLGIYGTRMYIYVLQSNRQVIPPRFTQSTFSASLSIASGECLLSWKKPTDAVRYHAVWSNKPIVETYSLDGNVTNWWAANSIGISLSKIITQSGTEQYSVVIPNIKVGDYVALFSFDKNDTMSRMSNVARVIDSDDDFACFSGHNTVQILHSRKEENAPAAFSHNSHTIQMSQLAVGDYVSTEKNGGFTRVISFCHRNPETNLTYVQIHSLPMIDVTHNASHAMMYPALEMTGDHLVYVKRNGSATVTWIPAAAVKVGDILVGIDGPQVVTHIDWLERRGLYAPITESGTLLVSGALVSSYVAILKPQSVPLCTPDWQHFLGHLSLTPVRLLCRFDFAKYCQDEQYNAEGYSWYSKVILRAVEWFGWGANGHFLVSPWFSLFDRCLLVVISLPFLFLHGMELLLFGNGVVYGREMIGSEGWHGGERWMITLMTTLLTMYIFRLCTKK